MLGGYFYEWRNAVRKFKYYEIDEVHLHRCVIISEEGIIERYWDYWCERMRKVGKESLISRENCIEDFCAIHWCVEVTE
jgi:hypothetical protein